MINTYLGLLDKSCLFELLLRLHYWDLWNLCKSHNYLYKITCSLHFIESWKKYNVKTVTCRSRCGMLPDFFCLCGPDALYEVEVDRQGLKHGIARCYNGGGVLQVELTYIQDILNGPHTSYRHGVVVSVRTYLNDRLHGSHISLVSDRSVRHRSVINGKIEGIEIIKHVDDRWEELMNYRDDQV